MKGINGRPAKPGQMYFESLENGEVVRKFFVGYFDGKKIGLTSQQLREFANNMPGFIPDLAIRLMHLKIALPK